MPLSMRCAPASRSRGSTENSSSTLSSSITTSVGGSRLAGIREYYVRRPPRRSRSRKESQTVAGTRAAAAETVISCRSAVKSEIVLVATVATGRALRPVASVLDTITTLSM